jgi:hypothetical protein
MKSFFLFISIILFGTLSTSAQGYTRNDERTASPQLNKPAKKKDLIDRLTFGGNFGASFGDVTFIEVSPNVGYHVTDDFIVGIGLTYSYLRDRRATLDYKTNIFGGRTFLQHIIFENFVAHAEYELLNLKTIDDRATSNFEPQRRNIHSLFVGGGFRSTLGGYSYINLLILYNLNDSRYSPYTNPQIRAGFGVGF